MEVALPKKQSQKERKKGKKGKSNWGPEQYGLCIYALPFAYTNNILYIHVITIKIKSLFK